jgi:hypothetical protein
MAHTYESGWLLFPGPQFFTDYAALEAEAEWQVTNNDAEVIVVPAQKAVEVL